MFSSTGSFLIHGVTLQVLEESGGLTLGSSSGSSDGDVGFKPQQADLFEFIKQSGQCGVIQVSTCMSVIDI